MCMVQQEEGKKSLAHRHNQSARHFVFWSAKERVGESNDAGTLPASQALGYQHQHVNPKCEKHYNPTFCEIG